MNILRKIALTVFAIIILTGCESHYIDVYVKNTSSQTISFIGEKNDFDDTYDGITLFAADTLTINSGEKVQILRYEDYYGFSREYEMEWLMKNVYPKGIKICFADGEKFEYHIDSLSTQFNSPYNKNSYFYHEKDNEHEATYMVLY